MQFNESLSDQYPASQATHVYVTEAPAFFLPFAQTSQRTLPAFAVLCVGQVAQEVEPANFENVSATQSTHSVLPAVGLNLPGTHGKHAADATSGWYLPAGQSRPLYVLYRVSKRRIMKKVRKVKIY